MSEIVYDKMSAFQKELFTKYKEKGYLTVDEIEAFIFDDRTLMEPFRTMMKEKEWVLCNE